MRGQDLRRFVPPPAIGKSFVWFLAWDVGGAKYLMDPDVQLDSLAHNVALCEGVFGWLRERRTPFLFTSSQMAGYPNAYGQTKALGDFWTRALGGQLAVLWNIYGAAPVSARSHVVPDILDQAARGVIRLRTDGSERRRFTHIDDCAVALVHQRESGQAEAHIADDEWTPVREVAACAARLFDARLELGPEPGYELLREPSLPLEGWRPRLSLEAGLRRTHAHMETYTAGRTGASTS